MSRLPATLARRIDRLARRAHRFHRWAHHPLCDRYAPDVIRPGRRIRVCRGCTFSVSGAIAGLGLGLALPGAPAAVGLAAAVGLVAMVPAAIPRRPATPGRHRAPKLLTRLAPTALAGALVGQALARPSFIGVGAGALALVAVAWALVRYRRRGPDRAACEGCPAGPAGSRCPGFAAVVRSERAFSRLAGRWMTSAALPGRDPVPAPPLVRGRAAGPPAR